MNKRDDFSAGTKRTLRDRVVHKCSSPACRKVTSGPNDKIEKSTNIGEAAHITAAAEGGPRYDKKMTPEQRKHINNGIWLCANCADLIDRDPEKYPVKLLHAWKKSAEDKAEQELGKRLPENSDAINTMTQALTGFPKNYISTAISNVHEASQASLEALDPRFKVITAYHDKVTYITIFPKGEDIPFKLNVRSNDEFTPKKLAINFRELCEHGKIVKLPKENIELQGLPLAEELIKNLDDVSLTFFPEKHTAIQKIWLINPEYNAHKEAFDDIHGFITHGSKSFTFIGEAYDGMLKFSYQKDLEGMEGSEFNISISLENWNNTNILFLPHFKKLKDFTDKLCNGWKLRSSLEMGGLEILTTIPIDLSENELINSAFSSFHYIECCQSIIKAIDKQLLFKAGSSASEEEHIEIEKLAKNLSSTQVFTKEQDKNAKFTLVNFEQNKISFDQMNELQEFVITQDLEVSMFGEMFELPTKVHQFNSVLPECTFSDDGNEIYIELIPQENYSLTIFYKNRDEIPDFLRNKSNNKKIN